MVEEVDLKILLRPEKAGLMETITVVPVTPDNPKGEFKAYSNPRNFKMMGTLCSIPPLWNSQIVAGKLQGGNTLLRINESEYQSYEIEGSGQCKFTVHLNQYKELSSISCTISATNWNEAVQSFHDLVDPYLSMLSWKYNAPLSISNINGLDIEHNYQYAKFIQPVPPVSFSIISEITEVYNDHIAALFSFHREMTNSTSGPYRLLCIYKCLTLVARLKTLTQDEAIVKGLDMKQYKSNTEVKIEENEMNKSVWPETIGWNLGRLIEDKVRPMRNKIAHELDNDDRFTNPDLGVFQEQIRDYADASLPLMRLQFQKVIDYRARNF